MNDDDECECGHTYDEHDTRGMCTVVGTSFEGGADECWCYYFELATS